MWADSQYEIESVSKLPGRDAAAGVPLRFVPHLSRQLRSGRNASARVHSADDLGVRRGWRNQHDGIPAPGDGGVEASRGAACLSPVRFARQHGQVGTARP